MSWSRFLLVLVNPFPSLEINCPASAESSLPFASVLAKGVAASVPVLHGGTGFWNPVAKVGFRLVLLEEFWCFQLMSGDRCSS